MTQMTELHYPSSAIAPSNSQAEIEGLAVAPSIRGGTAGGAEVDLGHWSTRLPSSLAA
ncbi:MAG: hypothetical protein ABEI57_03410 [Halapricum sp.]